MFALKHTEAKYPFGRTATDFIYYFHEGQMREMFVCQVVYCVFLLFFECEPSALPLSPCSGCDWILVSPRYVETDGDVDGWRELLSRLGVRDGLVIRKERRTLTAEELVRRTPHTEQKTPQRGFHSGACGKLCYSSADSLGFKTSHASMTHQNHVLPLLFLLFEATGMIESDYM